jgi:hypothetical protein
MTITRSIVSALIGVVLTATVASADSLPPSDRTIKVPCWVREYDHMDMAEGPFPDWWEGLGFSVISKTVDGAGNTVCTIRENPNS